MREPKSRAAEMEKPIKRHYTLQITISTLFILFTVILGSVLTLLNYNKTSDIILSSANQLYSQITQELALDFKATYSPMAATLEILSHSTITESKTLEQRLQYLKGFKAVLDGNTSYFSVGIAFPDGDFFVSTLLNNQIKRDFYQAPRKASLLVLHVDTDLKGVTTMTRLFFDDSLNEILRDTAVSDFDTLQRPWYMQATDTPSTTRPYLFHGIEIVGLTGVLRTKEPGVVLAIDITLDNLAETISKYTITDNSEVALVSSDGNVFAYSNPDVNIAKISENEFELPYLQDLDSDIFAYVGDNFRYKENQLDFEFNNKRWIGSSKIVARPGGVDLIALMVSPVDELLLEASAIRWQSLITTLLMISLSVPVIWLVAKQISSPLKKLALDAEKITRFEFDDSGYKKSFIKEVNELDTAMEMMKFTINKFIMLINSLAGEQDLDALLKSITQQTMLISKADGTLTYLLDETDNMMKPAIMFDHNNEVVSTKLLPELSIEDFEELLTIAETSTNKIIHLNKSSNSKLDALMGISNVNELDVFILPLKNRNNEVIGMLFINYKVSNQHSHQTSISFIEALSGFAAVTLESRQMLKMQEDLLNSFIKLIAGAIDSKSPYTGGHCQRVPEITFMLAQAACDSKEGPYKDFKLNDKEWQALEIACWLHDCGKVTTPEYVVDKSTKLETIYDRIHEVRMRFEVLKRDAEIRYLKKISDGGDESQSLPQLEDELLALDDDYKFIAECNEGGEFMAEDKILRLQSISELTWLRTLDDRIGISWEELSRKNRTTKADLPVKEKLLSDKDEHIIIREENERIHDDNQWGFKLDTPEYKYNRGELYNLAIKKGTLNEEERFKINEHMVQTVIMLNKLPYPKHMKDVPAIAGCHHETLDGKGYPKQLTKEDTPLTGRMMAIADIFEALTASDRPYKKAKTLSESIRILSFMKKDKHIDPDLFDLFLRSGAYLDYGRKFLKLEQIDEVDINEYLVS